MLPNDGLSGGIQEMNSVVNITNFNTSTISDEWPIHFSEIGSEKRGIYVFFVGFATFIGNFIVLISSGLIFKRGLKPKCTYLLLGSIAFADSVSGVIIMLIWFYPNNPQSTFPCSMYIGISYTSAIVSFYSVGLIAFDRFLFIVHGLKYNVMVFPRRVRKMIIGTWIFGLSLGFVPTMFFARKSPICWHAFILPKLMPIIVTLFGFIPVFTILILYSIILQKVLTNLIRVKRRTINGEDLLNDRFMTQSNKKRFTRSISSISGSIDDSGTFKFCEDNSSFEAQTETPRSIFVERSLSTKHLSLAPKKWRAIKIVLFTAGNVLFIWCMYCATTLMMIFCGRINDPFHCENLQMSVARYVGLCGLAHNIFNPIIYCWWHREFRKTLRTILCK